MPRRPSVRYWESRKAYCCWWKGKQKVLAEGPDDFPDGPVFKEAARKFADMIALTDADVKKDQNTVRTVCELYLKWISSRRSAGTVDSKLRILVPFTDKFDDMKVSQLTAHQVYQWLDHMRTMRPNRHTGHLAKWADGSVHLACDVINAVFAWGVKTGLITKNPVHGLERPEARSRGKEALTGRTPEERHANHRLALAVASKPFRPFVVVLEATGCRPGELAKATAADFDAAKGAIVYHAHEGKHKTADKGKERIILLTGEALEIVKELVKARPTGPIFRTSNKKSKGWGAHEIARRFALIREKANLPNLTAYSYRHTFATAWLEQGGSVDILASLLGNSPAIIRKHYSHLLGDSDNLRRYLEAFRSASEEKRNPPPTGGIDGEQQQERA